MAIVPLPQMADLPGFKKRLYQQYRVEIPCVQWQDHQFIRVSIQGYNTQADVDALLDALRGMLGRGV
jgi:isopenicillin-N epimerase